MSERATLLSETTLAESPNITWKDTTMCAAQTIHWSAATNPADLRRDRDSEADDPEPGHHHPCDWLLARSVTYRPARS